MTSSPNHLPGETRRTVLSFCHCSQMVRSEQEVKTEVHNTVCFCKQWKINQSMQSSVGLVVHELIQLNKSCDEQVHSLEIRSFINSFHSITEVSKTINNVINQSSAEVLSFGHWVSSVNQSWNPNCYYLNIEWEARDGWMNEREMKTTS